MNDFLQAEQSNVLHKPQSMGGDSLAMTLKKKREVETMLQQEREAAGFGYNTSSVPKKFKYTPGRNEEDIVDGNNYMSARAATPKINLLKLPKMAKKPQLMTHKRNGTFVPGQLDGKLMQSQDFASQAFASVRAGAKPFESNYE